jgi:D-alanine--poly(phosphoribitol) ligase subunit 2
MNAANPPVARVVALIRRALQVEVPDPDTDLIEAGLIDSLALISLITEVETEFGIELPLEDFDVEEFRSARQIAACVAAGGEGGGGS